MGQLAGSFQGMEIYGLKYISVQNLSVLAFKGHSQGDKGIRQTLDPQTNGPVTHIRLPSGFRRVEVDIYNLVQVVGDLLYHLAQLLKVKVAALGVDASQKLLSLAFIG